MKFRAGHNFHIVMEQLKAFGGEVLPRAAQSAVLGAGRDVALAETSRTMSYNAFKDKTGYLRTGFRFNRPRRFPIGKRTHPGALLKSARPHAHLVERGHGGPRPARPHPYLEPSFRRTFRAFYAAFLVRAEKHAQNIHAQVNGTKLMTRQTARWITGLRI